MVDVLCDFVELEEGRGNREYSKKKNVHILHTHTHIYIYICVREMRKSKTQE